jgi:hypothetical protein
VAFIKKGGDGKTHSIDPTVSFPFEVRGNIGPYVRHVNAASTKGEHGMDLPMAVIVQDKGDRLDSLVAGLYASLDLMGIADYWIVRWSLPSGRPHRAKPVGPMRPTR